jgi:hypothetical protein
MKRIVLALGLLIGTIVSACAACVGPAVMHDFPATSFNMSMATVPDGNCGSNVAVPTWAGGTLGAMANYGTSPGAVLVPGVNAFVTNTPPVSQSGTWTVQPGNTANTTPWLASISQGGNTAVVKAGNTAAAADLAVVVSDPTLQAIANAPTPAGTNLIGKVGIDQTTPGTTNGVQVNAALPAGTNTIGNFGFDPSSGKGTPDLDLPCASGDNHNPDRRAVRLDQDLCDLLSRAGGRHCQRHLQDRHRIELRHRHGDA